MSWPALLLMVLGLVCARDSQFNRRVNYDKLEKEWEDDEDDEDDDWHEDTYAWKERMEKKRKEQQKILDWKDPEQLKRAVADIQRSANPTPGGFQSFGSTSAGMSSMQMLFVALERDDSSGRRIDQAYAKQIVSRWQALLGTGGVTISVAVTPDDDPGRALQAIFTQDDGRVMDTKDFVLKQPECAVFKWNNKDYYPKGKGPQQSSRQSTSANDRSSKGKKKQKTTKTNKKRVTKKKKNKNKRNKKIKSEL